MMNRFWTSSTRMSLPSAALACAILLSASPLAAQIGTRFPSERKVINDPVTGVKLTFLTSKEAGDSKIYQTHHQWTSDGKWLVFRSNRVKGQAMAVNEESGDIVQVTESGYNGMLCLADHSMNLYFLRNGAAHTQSGASAPSAPASAPQPTPPAASAGTEKGEVKEEPRGPSQIVRVDLAAVFKDSAAKAMKPASEYEHVLGTVPMEMGAVGDVALDHNEDYVYFRVGDKQFAGKHLAAGTKVEATYGPRKMGAGPTGLAKMNLKTGEVSYIVSVPFQIGHVQTNPYNPGEIVFCWETGGKSPQRTWTVMADGTGLRPLYPEAPYEWVTHEAVITKDEVAIAIMGHRKPGINDEWGISGTREHPTGLGIVNLRTREMRIAGQTKTGSGLWHVNGSPDGRWAVGDDFARGIYLIDRKTDEMILLSTGHKATAADHPHPTFNADSNKIEIQSAMLSKDNRSMNICVISLPDALLKKTYTEKVQ